MTDDRRAEISIDHIPIRGGVGALLLIAVLIAAMLIELPQLRWPTLAGIGAGVVLGGGLILWRRRGVARTS